MLLALAALVVVAGFIHQFEKPVLAQVRAALIKNIDEPGRAPYMIQTVCRPEAGSNFCKGTFPSVPANKRFVVEYVNGNVSVDGSTLSLIALSVPSAGSNSFVFPAHLDVSTFGFNSYSISERVIFYYDGGQVPSIQILSTMASATPPSGGLTLSGYLVDLTE